jgi:hypothetical protein
MGKRELIIILGFVVIGAAVYRFTAPPPREGERGLSLTNLLSNVRRTVQSNSSSASFTETATVPVSRGLTEVRLSGVAGRVQVIGESRADIAYELTVNSTGPDEATALEYARKTEVKIDNLGTWLALRLSYPSEGRQHSNIVLRVPDRLAVRVDGSTSGTSTEASHVAGFHFEGGVGDVTVTSVRGSVTGVQRSGDLTVTDVDSVNLSLVGSQATFSKVARGLTLNGRSGEVRVSESAGPLEFDETNVDITVTGHNGPIRISGSSGQVTVNDPIGEVKVDVRRAEVEVSLARAVPLTLLTTDDTLRLLIDTTLSITLDAVASDGGRVQAGDVALAPEETPRESRLEHVFGSAPGAPRVVLRNQRGDIVIRKSK